MPPWTISVAQRREYREAMSLALGRPQGDELIANGQFDPRGLFVSRRGDRLNAVFACQSMAGGTALAWCPRGSFDDDEVAALIAEGMSWLRSRGVKVVEVIVRPEESDALAPLTPQGFLPAGPMVFLRRDCRELPDRPSLALTPFPQTERSVFASLLEQTYTGTLDFPELTGIRTTDEILTGYLAHPDVRPDRWWMASIDEIPAGILMLHEVEKLEGWDITYLGVAPRFRRRGLGASLLTEALFIVHDLGGEHLDVAVDARNAPALQLYRSLGFQLVGERLVSLAFLDSAQQIRSPY